MGTETKAGTATLYVVATPIGNLSDITLRALEVLKSVHVIAAEDTRMTSRLLERHGIAGKLMAVHEHNERASAERIAGLLAEGQSVADTAIRTTGLRDLYLALGDNRGNGRYAIRVYVSPLAPLIWLGALVMALGGMLSLWGRVRVGARASASETVAAE